LFKKGKGIRKSKKGGEFDQTTLYACMEISQLNLLIKLICANNKIKFMTHT
jgi:hypothetical protein